MFSIPFKMNPAEAECVTCIIQTKNICWDYCCHLPGSGIFTFQAERQLFQFSYQMEIGCSPSSLLHPQPSLDECFRTGDEMEVLSPGFLSATGTMGAAQSNLCLL